MANSPALTVKVIEAAPMLELLDPARITVKNVRRANPDQQFIESVRELGNFQPIGVLRAPDGELILRFGLQRLQACIETGRKVLAMVVDGAAGTSEADIERIFLQLDENDRRRDLTAGERAGAVAELFELGATERAVSRRTGLNKTELAAARTAAASATARTLAAQYPLTMDQLAVVAEFDGDQETAAELAKAAQDNPGQFPHLAERARNDRADAAMVAARAAELTDEGVTVTDQLLSYENRIMYWAGPDGKQLTPETHRNCPGSTVWLQAWGYQPRQVQEAWYCTDPKTHGHKKYRNTGEPEKSAEEATAERRRVREGNDAWRAATAVRERWLREVLLARKALPDGAALFIARAIAAADHHMFNAMSSMSGGTHTGARRLLGVEKDSRTGYTTNGREWVTPLVDSLNGVSEQRAQMITLALVLGAYEEQAADPQTWRHPSPPPQEYLTVLASWGYPPSPIEQGVVDAASGTTAAAVPAADEETDRG